MAMKRLAGYIATAAVVAGLTAAPAQADDDRWVAIAYSPSTGDVGAGWRGVSEQQAVYFALAWCSPTATDCKKVVTNKNACAALAVKSDGTFSGGKGATRDAAGDDAVEQNGGGTVKEAKCAKDGDA